MQRTIAIILTALSCPAFAGRDNCPNGAGLVPLTERVDIQTDTAALNQIIDGEWAGVGTRKEHAIAKDFNILLDGKPSYRFELKPEDNTLSGYAAGETKGRAELSYCYATASDYAGIPDSVYRTKQLMKTVYHSGKGICPQGSSYVYGFSVYISSEIPDDASFIFAQWHGMPDRRLAKSPDGDTRYLSDSEFLELESRTVFKKDTGYEKVQILDADGSPAKDKNGNLLFKTGKPNGWKIEQGGYPPLAFGFNSGYFYIKANSDRKWLTDKSDRCNANVEKSQVMVPVRSKYKSSTIAYRLPEEKFPKNTWVRFEIAIDWTKYSGSSEKITAPGKLDVVMSYDKNGKKTRMHIVDNEEIEIGRNDEDGYYFKFGIYRVGGSTAHTICNLGGFYQKESE